MYKKLLRLIKKILIELRVWELYKKVFGKDKGNPLNQNLLKEGSVFYENFIKSGDLVFDVGANYGNRVEVFLNLKANIVAVEPQQKCVNYLRKAYQNINIEQVGLGEKEEVKLFYEADNSVLSTFSDSYIEKVKNTRHKTSVWKKSKKIQITTLDNLIKKYGNPVFIKIDVEGYEYEVLKGLTRKSGVVSFEYNIPELKDELINCLDLLRNANYNQFNFSLGESMKFGQEWKNYEDFRNGISSGEFKMSNFGDIYAR